MSRRVALAILIVVDVAFLIGCLTLCCLGTGCKKALSHATRTATVQQDTGGTGKP